MARAVPAHKRGPQALTFRGRIRGVSGPSRHPPGVAMATFQSAVVETFQLRMDPDAALAFFADLDNNIRFAHDIESHEKRGPDSVLYVLKEQRSGTTTYKPRYVLRYTVDPAARTLRWTQLDEPGSTMKIRGIARFSGPAGGPAGDEQVPHPLRDQGPVGHAIGPGVVAQAAAVRPVAEGLIRRGIRGFVERMIAAAEAVA